MPMHHMYPPQIPQDHRIQKRGKKGISIAHLIIHIIIIIIESSTTVHKKILVPSNKALHKCAVCGCKFDRAFDKKNENWYFR